MAINCYAHEIIHLLRKMKSRGVSKKAIVSDGRSQPPLNKFEREMKRLDCSINYGEKKGVVEEI